MPVEAPAGWNMVTAKSAPLPQAPTVLRYPTIDT